MRPSVGFRLDGGSPSQVSRRRRSITHAQEDINASPPSTDVRRVAQVYLWLVSEERRLPKEQRFAKCQPNSPDREDEEEEWSCSSHLRDYLTAMSSIADQESLLGRHILDREGMLAVQKALLE